MGVSLAEYVRRLVTSDLGRSNPKPGVTSIFDLGSSGGSNIARNKEVMIAEAFEASRKRMRKSA